MPFIANGVDIFMTGLDKPNIGLLSDEFLAGSRSMPYRNLAVELLEKLINDGISPYKNNAVQERKYSERLRAVLIKYSNRAIETAQAG